MSMPWWVFAALIQVWLMALLASVTPLVNLILLAAAVVLAIQVVRERPIG